MSIVEKYIKLTQSLVTVVDLVDYYYLNQWKWCVAGWLANRYAARNVVIDGKHTTIAMHRVIMNAQPGINIKHVDGNGLNNHHYNLIEKL